jgi:hypothetical protein
MFTIPMAGSSSILFIHRICKRGSKRVGITLSTLFMPIIRDLKTMVCEEDSILTGEVSISEASLIGGASSSIVVFRCEVGCPSPIVVSSSGCGARCPSCVNPPTLWLRRTGTSVGCCPLKFILRSSTAM